MTAIAITGPTGVFGRSLVTQLEGDERVTGIVGVARREIDPAAEGWSKLSYRRGDVRDRDALAEAFEGADAVAHLAFAKFGHASHTTLREINVEGTLNALNAAAEAGARRFVFASSVAAYGFRADNPEPITEDWPARGSERWFYSREKAELEELLTEAVAGLPGLELTILRPTIVVGPRTAESWDEILPARLRHLARRAVALPGRLPVVPFPQPMQFVHETDVGQALRLALIDGPGGTFNLAGEGTVSGRQVARELGLMPLPVPDRVTRGLAAASMRLPLRPAALEAAEALTQPVLVDCSRARRELAWRPRFTSLMALRAGRDPRLSDGDSRSAAGEPSGTSASADGEPRLGT
jgi:nucleoside-diphosphate-sugar epimerase